MYVLHHYECLATFSGHSQILSRSCVENSGEKYVMDWKWWTRLVQQASSLCIWATTLKDGETDSKANLLVCTSYLSRSALALSLLEDSGPPECRHLF